MNHITLARLIGSYILFALLSVVPASGAAGQTVPQNVFQRRFVLYRGNLKNLETIRHFEDILKRAAGAGYNGILLGSGAGEYIDMARKPLPADYALTFAALRKEADALGVALIPYGMDANTIGYAAPDLVEAVPCRDVPFIVKDSAARIAGREANLFTNPGFENFKGNEPDGWSCDKPGAVTFIDIAVRHGGNSSVRIQDTGAGNPPHGHGRLWRELSVTPFHSYEFSVWIRTKDLTSTHEMSFYFEGLDGAQPLVYANRDEPLGSSISPTQDWKRYVVRFNSLSNSRLALFFGVWSPTGRGSVWFDDADLHEVGLRDVVRRDSLPVVVESEDGKHRYREGADYAVADGKLTIQSASGIVDGSTLKVSWYQRADMLGTPFASAAHPEYFQVARDIAEKVDRLFKKPSGFAMTYDEWRIANWDPAAGNITAGQYVADTTRKTIELLKTINPKYDIYVWSDMYDPNHNALDKYFMVNGSLAGSWKGLSKDAIILTWYGGAKTLKFFSDLGMRQVVSGYYESMDNVTKWLNDLDAAEALGVRGVNGFMYTTWEDKYDDLERVADSIKARHRWGANPKLK